MLAAELLLQSGIFGVMQPLRTSKAGFQLHRCMPSGLKMCVSRPPAVTELPFFLPPRWPSLPSSLPFQITDVVETAQLKKPETHPILQFLFVMAILLQVAPPASVIVLSASCLHVHEVALPLYISAPLALEVAHYAFGATTTRVSFGESSMRRAELAQVDRLSLWKHCLEDKSIATGDFITGWFYRRPEGGEWRSSGLALATEAPVKVHELQRGNLREWLSWSLFMKVPEELLHEELPELEEAISMLERSLSTRRSRFTFLEGYDETILSIRLNLDSPSAHHRPRPLLYYAISDGILCGLVTPLLMRRLGFRQYEESCLTYWHRPAAPSDDGAARASTPLVFVHGVGLGPLPYIGFIEDLTRSSDGPLIVIELPFVAQRLTGISRAPQAARTVDGIEAALRRHNIQAATFVGHSLGTIYLSWVARLRPSLLASAVFIDPICFLLHHSKVARSFLYSQPEGIESSVEHYFVKSELSIVSYFHRHFYWYMNNLWAKDLSCPTKVVLSEDDSIVPVDAVRAYLHRTKVDVLELEKARHGEFIMSDHARRKVIREITLAQHAGRPSAGSMFSTGARATVRKHVQNYVRPRSKGASLFLFNLLRKKILSLNGANPQGQHSIPSPLAPE